MTTFDIIAFDADDTLWHTERLYVDAQARFVQLLAHYRDAEWVRERLFQTEMRNMQHFGYGVKAFALSMIETAVELTDGQVSGQDIGTLIVLAKEMLAAEVELLPHVAEAIPALAARYPLMVITKGDLLDQETKIARSGLGGYFRHVEIVSEKTTESYRAAVPAAWHRAGTLPDGRQLAPLRHAADTGAGRPCGLCPLRPDLAARDRSAAAARTAGLLSDRASGAIARAAGCNLDW